MSDARAELIDRIRKKGLQKRSEPFRLSSGEMSFDYIDGKFVVADAEGMKLAATVIKEIARERGAEFTVVGGLTMGADALAHAVAMAADAAWFTVRKQAKQHGKERLIEGMPLDEDSRVLLVDDIVTTGGSILQALDAVEAAGATVTLAVTLVDRGQQAAEKLGARGVPYAPVATYEDLGIDPVGPVR